MDFMKILAKDEGFNVSLLTNSMIFLKPRSIRLMGQNKDLWSFLENYWSNVQHTQPLCVGYLKRDN